MWVFLSDSFLSIVNSKPLTRANRNKLVVRARVAGDIERIFPTAVVTSPPGRDYAFRAVIDRSAVAATIAAAITSISYTNFKDSVPDQDRHDAYLECWMALHDLQVARGRSRQS